MTQPSDQATTSISVAMYQRVPAWPHGGGALAMDSPRSHMAYLHDALAADEDVPGLDVPVDDVALVILPAPLRSCRMTSSLVARWRAWTTMPKPPIPNTRVSSTRPFSEEEVKTALFSMNSNRALGPYNIPAEFYQQC